MGAVETALIQSERLASMGRVAAMIAHEINNPLTAIQNILYAFQNDMAGPSREMYLTLAETEVWRAIQIAQNTLGLSRPSAAAKIPIRRDAERSFLSLYPRTAMRRKDSRRA